MHAARRSTSLREFFLASRSNNAALSDGDLPAINVGDDRLRAECRKADGAGGGNVDRGCYSAEALGL